MSDAPLWSPTNEQLEATQLHGFAQAIAEKYQLEINEYHDLWSWSVTHPDLFWSEVWSYAGVVGDKGEAVLQDADKMPGAKWFPEARLNFAENLLQYASSHRAQDAIVFWGENQTKRTITNDDLLAQVSQCQQLLSQAGIGPGDRVAGYLPNMPEAVVAMLATASLGAIWSSASPDFGIEGVLDRFGQIEPKYLFCTDGYFYNGKWLEMHSKNQAVCDGLSSLSKVVLIPYGGDAEPAEYASLWSQSLNEYEATAVQYTRLPFDHPLYILFSSGTTGAPKCIVHGAGGTLLQHIKEHRLHSDVRPGDRLFYFTTLGWMMWNWLVSGLANGATLLLYDGSPFAENDAGKPELIFDLAQAEGMTQLGTSAKYLEAANKAGLDPANTHDLRALRSVFSTGSPLAPEGFRYVYQRIKDDVLLASISGGTDIVSCFALGAPTLPVWIGELQCRGLGMTVDVYDDDGQSLASGKGDLVCTKPFPSMPVGFWNDADGSRYHSVYFDRFDNVWCHGDYVELTEHGGMIIHGRSDAVLNPGGVRIGTAEIYRQVEKIEEVLESIVIGQQWQSDVRVVLFVVLRAGMELDQALIDKIKLQIRSKTTPRHVPAKVIQVSDIPRTKSGKIVELAVRDTVHGKPVKNKTALANPEALDLFHDLADLQN